MLLNVTMSPITLIKTLRAFAVVLLLAFTASSALSQTAPVVSNVFGVQRAGTKLVDITYDLADTDSSALNVTLQISSDAGSTWTVPTTSATGQVGAGITPGSGLAIVWDAGTDWNNLLSTTMRYRITVDDDFTGLALIPAGSFTMGRTSGDTDVDAPPVSVYVSSFYMAKFEVTKALWDEVRTWGLANGYTDLQTGAGKAANHPVHSISWYDMVKWCNARSQKEGLTPCYTTSNVTYKTGDNDTVACNWSALGYRLPTEAEWEQAARGGVIGQRFPWGDTITHALVNYDNDESLTRGFHATYATGNMPYTSPVGSFTANGYGLYDMTGNVLDWCWDRYSGSSYVNGASDPRGPASGAPRVLRGGCWYTYAINCRAADRGNSSFPVNTNNGFGFRPARSSFP
jgi:formylglycine-generating enzyme required for sulfatase activity